jgi:hypothetical protein
MSDFGIDPQELQQCIDAAKDLIRAEIAAGMQRYSALVRQGDGKGV